MRVSVVVPARNEEAFLPHCLQRIAHQTLKPLEVIVVDSASTDRTAQVAKDHGARVIRLDEPGVGRARHAGFQAAAGEVIASTDADALVPRDWLERLVSPFGDPAVVGSFGTVSPQGYPLSAWVYALFQRVNWRLGIPLFCGPNFAVRREAFLKVGGFLGPRGPYQEAEDVRLGLKLRRVGRIIYLPYLSVEVSPRSLSPGYVLHHIWLYIGTCWLRREDV